MVGGGVGGGSALQVGDSGVAAQGTAEGGDVSSGQAQAIKPGRRVKEK